MIRKTVTIAAVAALVTAGVFIAIGDAGQVAACDGKTKSASASAAGCTKSASAAKVSAASAGTSSGCKTKTASTAASCSKTAQAQSACCAKMAKQAHYTQVKNTADNIPYRVNSRVVVSGTYKCGSCDLGTTDKCQAFLKTASGELYPMVGNKSVKGMYKMHKKGKNDFEVTARVSKQYGAKYLDVTHFDTL